MLRALVLAAALALAPFLANAATFTQAAGTITAGNAFQTVVAASAQRQYCLIQNTSTHIMYVYVGTLADATALKSFQVAANGGTWSCNAGNFVVSGTISITTSTTSDPYVVAYQQ